MSVILILNGGCNTAGELNPDTTGRIEVGMQLAALRPAAQVIMVGGLSASIMRDFALEHYPGIQTPLVEDESRDTIEGAHYVKMDYLSTGEYQEVDVATTDFHIPRAQWIFSKVLGPGYDLSMHLAPSNHSPALKHKESIQFAIARLKLLGLRPEDDDKRAERLAHFRFRGSDNRLVNLIEAVDRGINHRLKQS